MRAPTAQAVRYPPQLVQPGATVTVVVPCFNYARYLTDAVRSALTQSDVEVDVVIVDDASTDDSRDVAAALAREDGRVRVLTNPTNRGPVVTFNRGLAAARGEYLVRLDADDLLTPGALSRAVAVMQRFPDVGLVYGHPLHFTEDRPAARRHPEAWTIWSGRDWLEVRCAAGTNVITSPEVVVRRSVLDRVGGQHDLAHTHDMELWLRVSAYADVAYLDGCDQAWHREHAASLSNQAAAPGVFLREIRDAFEVLCDGLEPDPEADRLRRLAHRAVSLSALGQARRYVDRGDVPAEVEDLRDFALALYPAALRTATGRRFAAAYRRARSWPTPAVRTLGLAPRAARRLRTAAGWVRWQRTGMFEPVRVTAARWSDQPDAPLSLGRAS
ncbi:glycosyltransferase family 2 protein [Georgenia deserti]|uniref:Glycosyltransferase family 2 protein n=1 Tax=Georgenia deserti TaxID=2093781 RepID=A0ABW4LA22_9MICO